MKNKLTTITALFLSATVLSLNVGVNQALAQDVKFEASVPEDSLNNLENMPWGGDDFPYSKVTKIEDTLSPEYVLGYVVMDRHGIDNSDLGASSASPLGSLLGGLTKQPFTTPAPGKEVYISLWGAKSEGCFAELIMQLAPKQQLTEKDLTPTMLEMGVGGRTLQLKPQAGAQPQIFSGGYTYEVSNGTYITNYSSVLYVSKMRFAVDATVAAVLMSAPAKNVKVRIKLPSSSIVIELGKKTVERWKTIYGVNPTCENLNQ